MIVFDGEFVNAQTGEEKTITGLGYGQVLRMLQDMSDGDALVVKAREEREEDWR